MLNYDAEHPGQRAAAPNTMNANPDAPGGFAAPIGSEAAHTPLEHLLDVELWHPTDARRRAEENLPKHVRRKEYRDAAECQTRITKAGFEIERWNGLIAVARKERKLLERVAEYFGESCVHPLANDVRAWLNAYPPNDRAQQQPPAANVKGKGNAQ